MEQIVQSPWRLPLKQPRFKETLLIWFQQWRLPVFSGPASPNAVQCGGGSQSMTSIRLIKCHFVFLISSHLCFSFDSVNSQENGPPSSGRHVSVDSSILPEILTISFQLNSVSCASRFNIRRLVSYISITFEFYSYLSSSRKRCYGTTTPSHGPAR